MNSLEELDPAKRLARVEPGIVLDRLRDAAELHQLTYAPDPATHSRCTLGGMIGNNSCGVHGLLGGKVVDNVESLDIALYDGTRMTVGATSPERLDALIRAGGRVGQIYAGLARLRDRYAALVREKFPRIPRRVSGYNLDELLPENNFHVARALVGSEGTCANVVSATLNLTASPPFRVLTVLGFNDAFLAADAVPLALEHKPIGLEGFDSLLVDFMRRKGLALRDLDRLPPGFGFLLVEMGAWSAEEARAKAESLARASQSWPSPPVAHICAPDEAQAVWHVRESALGAMVFVPGEPDRWEGWEDSAVPPAQLGKYLRAITRLMAEYGFSSPLYGHYGQGCVHMRINFDFRSAEGIRTFREFIDRAAETVLSFGGSLSGEHGDGQARAALLPKMFGPELVEAFREFKALWDPDNRMNPGKLSDAVRVYDPVENLRHPVAASAPEPALRPSKGLASENWEPNFSFAKDDGSFERASERCVGVGACRNTEGGVMCPSYRATGEEQHSTRGRAHLLWEMLAGSLRQEGFQSRAVHEALDLCLSCKACKSECPVQVDMAAYKSEFLAQHYKGRLHPHPSLHLWLCRSPRPLRLNRPVSHQRHPHWPAHQSTHQAHRRRCPRAPLAASGLEKLPKGATDGAATHDDPHKSRPRVCPTAGGPKVRPIRRWCCGPIRGITTTIRNLSPRPKPSLPKPDFRLKLRAATSAAAGRSTISVFSEPLAPILRTCSAAWPRKFRSACPSSSSSQAVPASSKTSCWNSSQTIPARNA